MVGSINDQVANFDVKVDLEVKLETKLYKGLKNPQIVPRQSVLPCPHVDNPLSSCQPPVEKNVITDVCSIASYSKAVSNDNLCNMMANLAWQRGPQIISCISSGVVSPGTSPLSKPNHLDMSWF